MQRPARCGLVVVMNTPAAPVSLSQRLALIIGGLCHAAAARASRERAMAPVDDMLGWAAGVIDRTTTSRVRHRTRNCRVRQASQSTGFVSSTANAPAMPNPSMKTTRLSSDARAEGTMRPSNSKKHAAAAMACVTP